MKKLISMLQLFAGGHSVTVIKDAHMTTASASSTEDVQADATVTLTLTPATNYEVADVEVLAGGVTVHQDNSTISFTMGSSDVVISVTSQKNNEYKVFENKEVWVNGSRTELKRNQMLEIGKNGMVIGTSGTPTAISLAPEIITALLNEGVIVKNHAAWKGTPTPSA